MRTKESAEDYRYFPEPDLPPLVLSKEWLDKLQKHLPELPHERFLRYTGTLGISPYSASLLINDKPLCDIFEHSLSHTTNAKALCNWITVEFVGRIKESGKSLTEFGIKGTHIASLVNLIEAGTLTGRLAKEVADEMVQNPGLSPEEIVNRNPHYRPITDSSEIAKIIDHVLSLNNASIQDYHAGKEKAFQFLIGQVMKETKGKASPDMVKNLLKAKIG